MNILRSTLITTIDYEDVNYYDNIFHSLIAINNSNFYKLSEVFKFNYGPKLAKIYNL